MYIQKSKSIQPIFMTSLWNILEIVHMHSNDEWISHQMADKYLLRWLEYIRSNQLMTKFMKHLEESINMQVVRYFNMACRDFSLFHPTLSFQSPSSMFNIISCLLFSNLLIYLLILTNFEYSTVGTMCLLHSCIKLFACKKFEYNLF